MTVYLINYQARGLTFRGFNRSLCKQTWKKQRLYNKAKKSGSKSDWLKFKIYQKFVKQSLRSARNKYYADFSEDPCKKTQKSFWAHIKHLKKGDPGVADVEIDEDIITADKGKAEILNDHFTSVFTEEDLSTVPDMGVDPELCAGALNYKITVEGFVKQLNSLNPHKASGPDGIPSWFLRENAAIIAPILTHIFQESVDTSTVPDQWAIFKKGKKLDPTNYRPVSLTCMRSFAQEKNSQQDA